MTPAGRNAVRIGLRIEQPKWRVVDLALLRRAARSAVLNARRTGELTVLLASDERLCALNQRYRGKAKPTNVLSFPARPQNDGYLGDIALAFGVAEREAAAGRKRLTDHAAHLIVHGVLHLLGYDHETARDARVMEGLEVAILKQLGIGNPYVSAPAAE